MRSLYRIVVNIVYYRWEINQALAHLYGRGHEILFASILLRLVVAPQDVRPNYM